VFHKNAVRFIWTLLILLVVDFAFSQTKMQGQVIDFDTTVPMAFVKIKYNNQNVQSDWEGKFSLEINEDKNPIYFSYKGYSDKVFYKTTGSKSFLIKMVTNKSLRKEEIFSENWVNTIVKKVIENKSKNNPEKAIGSFQYKNYEHLLVSANADSISNKIDTIVKKRWFGKAIIKLDSSNYKFKKLIQEQHLYQTEKVNLFQHNQSGNKETVLAARMAGFKKPLYEYLGLNLVSYSVYDNSIKILETPILNPISKFGRYKFVFKLIDTLQMQNRTIYRIYFQPKNQNKNSLRGLIYVDAQSFAIAKAFYRIYGMVNINALYTYHYHEDFAIWFPEKRKITVVKGNNHEDLNLLIGNIKFNSSLNQNLNTNATDQVFLKLESTPFDIEWNKNVSFKLPQIKIDVPENSLSKPNTYWNNIRKDTVDFRKIKTYTNIDSLSVAEKIEEKLIVGRKIIKGFYPIKFIDIDLRSLVKYNNFEGFRLGVGCVTNHKLSDQYKISFFGAYGLKDEKIKFGITPSLHLDTATNTWISIGYTDDNQEIASTFFAIDSQAYKFYDSRPINISTFYDHKTFSAFIESRYIPKTSLYFGFSRTAIKPLFAYNFSAKDNLYKNYNISTLKFALQWNPFSSFMQTPSGRIEIDKKFPKIAIQLTQSIPNLMSDAFSFSKLDLRFIHEIPFLSGQKLSFMAQVGVANGDTPLTHLYSISPNNLPLEKPIDYISIAGENSFETMFYNEFFSSKFVSLQLKHSFDKVKLGYKLNPEIVLASRVAFGTMEKPEQHQNFNYKTLDKGFFESGVEINKIWKGFGLNCFYRYGANSLPKFSENISVKFSFILDLGF
jgi:Family of unknown function (DUF5686)